MRDLFCFDEWLTVQENKKQRRFFRSRSHFRLPVCEALPSRDDAVPEPLGGAACSGVELFHRHPALLTCECCTWSYQGEG